MHAALAPPSSRTWRRLALSRRSAAPRAAVQVVARSSSNRGYQRDWERERPPRDRQQWDRPGQRGQQWERVGQRERPGQHERQQWERPGQRERQDWERPGQRVPRREWQERERTGPLLGPARGAPPPLPPSGELRYYATCHPGLEEVVAEELRSSRVGAARVRPGRAGVSFVGDAVTGYRANLWLRSAIRVLQFLADADLDPRRQGGDEVYRAVREAAPWTELLRAGQTFSVDARVRSCGGLSNSQLLAVRAKDAICDYLRDRRGVKPEPPAPGAVADLPLYCTAYQDRLTLFRDLSGASLHRRGYRRAMHRASLNESAAAGILYLAGWDDICRENDGEAALADPMCGSGTILIEAALMASNTAPGLLRPQWPFQAWPDFDRQAWKAAVEGATSSRHAPRKGLAIWGNDIHAGALALARRDAEAARVLSAVKVHQGDCREWVLPQPPRLVVCNPPWGQRLLGDASDGAEQELGAEAAGHDEKDRDGMGDWWEGGSEEAGGRQARGGEGQLAAVWHGLSVFLKEQCGGAEAYLLSGSVSATQHLRLRADKKWPLSVGGTDCRLLKYGIRGRAPEGAAAAGGGRAASDGVGAASS